MSPRRTERPIPVLLGDDYAHVMAHAVIEEDPGKTTVTIVAEGRAADILGAFLTAPEPVAVSFSGIPVQPRKKNIKER